MRPELPSGTVTFLFTDVEGSTRLLNELGPETYAHALGDHRHVIREACARHRRTEVDTQGDAFFFAFPTAAGALAAAADFSGRFTVDGPSESASASTQARRSSPRRAMSATTSIALERFERSARAALGDTGYDAAVREGEAFSDEAAIELPLSVNAAA